MAKRPPNDSPLQELKHEAVPGYFKAFIIAFAVMGIYLVVILITSPGSARERKKSGAPTSHTNPEHPK